MADVISSRGSKLARLTHKAKRLDVKTPFFETAKCNNHPDPDWFFDIEAGHGVKQKKFCADCPVLNECLDYALNVKVLGVWGGTTPEEWLKSGAWRKADIIDFGPAITRVQSGETTIQDEVERRWQTLSVLEGVQ